MKMGKTVLNCTCMPAGTVTCPIVTLILMQAWTYNRTQMNPGGLK